jgi:hypothetical protein
MAIRRDGTAQGLTIGARSSVRLRNTLSLAACVLTLGNASTVYALNGEDYQTVRVYNAGTCEGLRTTPGATDLILTCLEAPGGERSCDRLAAAEEGGGAVGSCESERAGGGSGPIGGGDLERNEDIRRTTFLSIMDRRRALTDTRVITYCQTFPPESESSDGSGQERCVTFIPDPSKTPDCHPGWLPVVQNQGVCAAVTEVLQNSVQKDAQPIFVALVSTKLVADPASTELVACGAHGWECGGLVDDFVDQIDVHLGHVIDTPCNCYTLSSVVTCPRCR